MSGDPHSLDVFSGESIIKGLNKKLEKAKLLDMQKILGLESFNLAEMIILCAAIGLYRTVLQNDQTQKGSFTKMAPLSVFDQRKFANTLFQAHRLEAGQGRLSSMVDAINLEPRL